MPPRKKIPEMKGSIAKPVKIKRKRKPMTEEQKAAATERLAKAREAKAPAQNKSVHESIRDLPDENVFSPKKAKEALKHNQELLKSLKGFKNSKDASERAHYNKVGTYVDNLKNYLSTGIYKDNRYGNDMQGRVTYKCVAMAYHKDGTPKRCVGTWYPDVGEWTLEMEKGL